MLLFGLIHNFGLKTKINSPLSVLYKLPYREIIRHLKLTTMKKIFMLAGIAAIMFSCMTEEEATQSLEQIPINISVNQQTRANDSTYENGDEIGLFVVNHEASTTGELLSEGNHADNAKFTYNDGIWTPIENLFWKDQNTAADFYAYYPYSESVNIAAQPFEVKANQSQEADFWASDFLWGKTVNVVPTPNPVNIKTTHSLSRVIINIKPGKGFTAETWAAAEKSVKICNIQTAATIDLSTGVATASGDKGEIIPFATTEGASYKAMMVPQEIKDNSKFVVITVDGIDYIYRNGYIFKANTQHEFTVTVNRTEGSVNITIGEWEIDESLNEGIAEVENVPTNQIWYTSNDGEVVTPQDVNAFGATISSNTYENGKGIITFEEEITSIEEDAFDKCVNLTTITLPNSVSFIGRNPFYDCSNLSAFYGKFASDDNRCLINKGTLISFAPAGLTSYTIPDEVTIIGYSAFKGIDNIKEITIPNSVTKIGGQAFHGCWDLTSVTIPESVTEIDEEAFTYCSKLTGFYGKFATDDNKALIVNNVFNSFAYGCGDTTYTIPDGVTKIGGAAFYANTKIAEVTIPSSITAIGHATFAGCINLASIDIPENVIDIDDFAFYCKNVKSIICRPTTPPTGGKEMFEEIPETTKIYVPIGSGDTYKTSDYWADYADHIEEMEM